MDINARPHSEQDYTASSTHNGVGLYQFDPNAVVGQQFLDSTLRTVVLRLREEALNSDAAATLKCSIVPPAIISEASPSYHYSHRRWRCARWGALMLPVWGEAFTGGKF